MELMVGRAEKIFIKRSRLRRFRKEVQSTGLRPRTRAKGGNLWGHLAQLLNLLIMKKSPIKNMLEICTIGRSFQDGDNQTRKKGAYYLRCQPVFG